MSTTLFYKHKAWGLITLALAILASGCGGGGGQTALAPPPRPDSIDVDPPATYLTPEESLKKMYLPKGYHLQLVASEPMVQEPVAIAWDGDGRMYVAEMLTYMEDVNGSNENLPTSRILRLEDTDGDGKMDKSTVFIDSLVLPRMMLCVGNQLIVNETYSYNLWSYEDTNGDGKADKKTLVYHNDSADTRNLEHQKSGLVWNIDNWIYVSADPVRYRYVNQRLEVDTLPENPGGQWGIAQDDYGRLYFSSAGGETPALNFQQNPAYGRVDLRGELADSFDAVWPVIGTPDVQGGTMRVRSDSTLNHFTSCNGQSIFRGDRLPEDLRGDLLICEPVGRLIRRAKVSDSEGIVTLRNAYHHAEFIASADMNFRPVNTATGPDGCLYIVDMYHGIIQEHEWTKEGSYLRPRILRKGLDKNIGRGRIYRLVHDGYTPGPAPHLLEASSADLVGYLDHPNGWWRDEAQKLLVVRGDRSVVPALKRMALGSETFWDKLSFWKKKPSVLGRLHALWTLDGLGAMTEEMASEALGDPDPHIRKAAVQISEKYLSQHNAEILSALEPLMKDPSADVRFQLFLSLRSDSLPEAQQMTQALLEENQSDELFAASWKSYLRMKRIESFGPKLAGMSGEDRRLFLRGAMIFNQLCATCHGADGKGTSTMVAPALAGQPRVNGDEKVLIKILLKGLTGPVDGKSYPDVMPSMEGNNDQWIASVISYIRNDLGNKAPVVHPEEVKKIRASLQDRKQAWTIRELANH